MIARAAIRFPVFGFLVTLMESGGHLIDWPS
jgi:hypothetical protein